MYGNFSLMGRYFAKVITDLASVPCFTLFSGEIFAKYPMTQAKLSFTPLSI